MMKTAAIEIADLLDNVPRIRQSNNSEPSRDFVVISDEQAREWANRLREDSQKQNVANMQDSDWIQREVEAGFTGERSD